MTLTMNKVSGHPVSALPKAIVNLSSAKEEDFFKTIRPLIAGAKLYTAMDSGSTTL